MGEGAERWLLLAMEEGHCMQVAGKDLQGWLPARNLIAEQCRREVAGKRLAGGLPGGTLQGGFPARGIGKGDGAGKVGLYRRVNPGRK